MVELKNVYVSNYFIKGQQYTCIFTRMISITNSKKKKIAIKKYYFVNKYNRLRFIANFKQNF